MKRGVILLAILSLALIPVWAATRAQTPEQKLFPQTGHEIAESFFEAYYQIEEPLAVYGFPITAITLSKDDRTVQYFSLTRFELDAEGSAVRTPLGRIYYEREQPEAIESNLSGPCRLFEETGQQVCHEFLAFFLQHGGVEQFGLPLSSIAWRDGRMVQYFEYAILEYRPDVFQNSNIGVADLGQQYFRDLHEKESLLRKNAIPVDVLDLNIQAFVARDSTAQDYESMLYVIVKDQTRSPVADASVAFTIVYPDGTERHYGMETTNRFGFSKMRIFPDVSVPGIVKIKVNARYLALSEETRTSFRIWY